MTISLRHETTPNIAKPVLSLGSFRKAIETVNTPVDVKSESACTKPPVESVREPLPFVLIQGAVYPGEPSWTDWKSRAAALNWWFEKIVKEVVTTYHMKAEQDAVEAFVRSHRLSIASAFERRIVRADVVTELVKLFRDH